MINKRDLETLSETRLADAEHLFQAGRFSAAYYIAGYAIELGIKACIAGVFQANVIPDKSFVAAVYSHKLNELLGLAGIKMQMQEDMKNDPALSAAWGIASKWNEASRYEMWDQFAAASMIHAVKDPTHGVLPWLKKHW
jgi:HEPN domain-containing protein